MLSTDLLWECARNPGGGTGHRCPQGTDVPAAAAGSACRDGGTGTAGPAKLWGWDLSPLAGGGMLRSPVTPGTPRSLNIPCSAKGFSPFGAFHVTQEGAEIPDELQGGPFPHKSLLQCPSRTFPGRKAVPREHQGMDRGNFPSQSPRESKEEDKPVKVSSSSAKGAYLIWEHSSTPGITNLQLRNLHEDSTELQSFPWIN